jgi:predicted nucleic acid-binding Zn ribbon protein
MRDPFRSSGCELPRELEPWASDFLRVCTYDKVRKTPSRYCSASCYRASRIPRKSCAVCGKALRASRLTYCSKQCFRIGRRPGHAAQCEHCGAAMYVEPNQFNKRFCSRKCLHQGMRLKGPGSRIKRKDDYIAVYFPSHPDAGGTRFMMEHRLVMRKSLVEGSHH